LIFLTALGVITVFWEPLTALAVGAPSADTASPVHAPATEAGDAGSPAVPDASGNS
jgi:hypothetical protein